MAEEKKTIRVMVVDDHKVVRGGLSDFLFVYDDLELAGEASSGEDAVLLCPKIRPDVVLMDLVMEGMDGADATRAIRTACPEIQVIALTSFKDDDLVQRAIKAGAIGYLLKTVTAEDLAKAIRDAYLGRPTLAPEAAQALMVAAVSPPKIGHDLTPREMDVLALMVRGKSNREIAGDLSISLSTVKHHVRSILEKLNVSNRSEAVAVTLKHRLIG
jgi:NarL family two-component system response regulator LiaR